MDTPVSPEDEAGFFSRLYFCWVTPLIKAGQHHPLQDSDLYPLAKGTASGELGDKFELAYKKIASKSDDSKLCRYKCDGFNSMMALMQGVLGWRYWATVLLKALWICLRITQVYLLREIVIYVTRVKNADANKSVWVYIALAFTLFCVTIGQGLALNMYHYYGSKFGLKAQTAVAAAVYRKALRLSLEALNSTETVGRMGNLLMNDSERLYYALAMWHLLWFGIFEVSLLAALISVELGRSGLFCFPFLLVLVAMLFFFAGLIARSRKRAMMHADSRVQTMGSVIHDMRSVKLNTWEPYFLPKIASMRRREIRQLAWANLYNAANDASVQTAPLLLSLMLFASYTLLFGSTLTPASVFSSLAFLNVLGGKLMTFPNVFRLVAEAMISLARLDRFFAMSEISSNTSQMPMSADIYGDAKSRTSLKGPSENSDLLDNRRRLCIIRADFGWKRFHFAPGDEAKSEHFPGEQFMQSGAGDHAALEVDVDNRPLALKCISVEVTSGDLVSIVGPVGSGKSCLLLAMLGELPMMQGSLWSCGTVAYCAQHPWIMNGTVRENITLFFSRDCEFDEELYECVVDACCLTDELAHLPAGDLTEIGERGINLSGGQKARLALARAIYSDADIYLFDDPLSAVDSIVGKHLKDHVFGPCGILAKKARVVVTHQLQLLPLSNTIYMLESGSVIASGTLEQLMDDGHTFSNMGIYSDPEEKRSLQSCSLAQPFSNTGANNSELPSRDSSGEYICHSDKTCNKSSSICYTEQGSEGEGHEKPEERVARKGGLTISEDRRVGRVSWLIYWDYIKAAGGILALFGVLGGYAASQGTRLVGEWWLARWSTDGFDKIESSNSIDGNRFYTLCFVGFTIGFGVFALLQGSILTSRVMTASRRLHDQLVDRIMCATPAFFESNPTGRILNRFSKDVDDMDSLLPNSVQQLLKVIFITLGALVTISWILPWFLISLVPIAAMFWVIQHRYVLSSRELKRLDALSKSPAYSLYTETLTGLLTVRAHSAEKDFRLRFQDKLDKNVQARWQYLVSQRWIGGRLDALASTIVLLTGVIIVIISGKLDPGLAGVALSQSLLVCNVFQWGAKQKTECENTFTGVERIIAMATETPTEAPPIIPGARPDASWPSAGIIEFDDVELRYRPHLEPALNKLSFKTESCERIGVCGRTGAGKSSIFVALFRMVELSGGRILVDDVDISKIGLRDHRSSLGIVPQEPALFNATIRENIDPLGTHSDAELWAALDCVHMGTAASDIEIRGEGYDSENLRYGLDQIVSDGGKNFSSGERQLLCLARVLLSDVRVVVLDEATASIDNKTDAVIQQAVRKHLKDRTVITIAHRLDTIVDSDRILVMERGVAVELDTPKNLLAKRGYFTKMVEETGEIESAELRNKILAHTA